MIALQRRIDETATYIKTTRTFMENNGYTPDEIKRVIDPLTSFKMGLEEELEAMQTGGNGG